MRCLVLFAGGGGSTLGLVRAGFDCLGVEYDRDAHAVHVAHGHPCLLADIREIDAWLHAVVAWANGEPIGLWASPPCQDWSTAGKRAGAQGERNGWPWTWAAIDALRAAGVRVVWLRAENVPGMLHHSASGCGGAATCPGCYFRSVVVPEASARFPVVDYRVLDAVDYGVPQHRERVILAGGDSVAWPRVTHHPIGGLFRPWWRTVRDALEFDGYLRAECSDAVARSSSLPAPTTGTRGTLYAGVVDLGRRVRKHPASALEDPARIVSTGEGHNYVAAPCTTVTATEGRGCASDARRASRTLGRRLTPDECALLQAWPEVIPALVAARTKEARYRVVGNAVPPPLAEAVGLTVSARREVAA